MWPRRTVVLTGKRRRDGAGDDPVPSSACLINAGIRSMQESGRAHGFSVGSFLAGAASLKRELPGECGPRRVRPHDRRPAENPPACARLQLWLLDHGTRSKASLKTRCRSRPFALLAAYLLALREPRFKSSPNAGADATCPIGWPVAQQRGGSFGREANMALIIHCCPRRRRRALEHCLWVQPAES